jgi:hypothetical protein
VKIGHHDLRFHQGLALERLSARMRTGSRDPVLAPREPGSKSFPTLTRRPRTEAPDRHRTPRTTNEAPGVALYEKWRPEDRFVVCANDGEDLLRKGAKVQAVDHRIPPENCFHYNTRPSGKGRSLGTALHEGALSDIQHLHQRLDIHSHGTEFATGQLSAEQLAEKLHHYGVRRVGVLKIQACDVGKGDYLERLRGALHALGIEVGYLCAPTGKMHDVRVIVKVPGLAPRIATGIGIQTAPRAILVGKGIRDVAPETSGLKVIKGTVDIAFPGTRYSLRAAPPPPLATS